MSTPAMPATPLPPMKVGFVGLGHMGLPLAMNLVNSGVPVVAYNRTQEKLGPLVGAGATWATSPRDLARGLSSGVVFVMVTDSKAVKAVLFGRSGVAAGAGPGMLVVNLSTIDPDDTRAFAARLGERGVHYVDAPVGGSVDQAVRREVSFFAGGDDADVARVRPLLERMGRQIEHLGPVGAGTAAKLVNNLLTIGITELSAEALALSESFGLDRARMLEILQAGGGRSAMLERKASLFQSRSYPAQFTTALARKDLKLIERAASREGRPLRMTREGRKLLDAAIARGHANDDFASVLEVALAPRPPPVSPPTPSSDPRNPADAGSPPPA